MNKILIIDDDIIIQELLKAYLADEGYTLIVAASGEEGLQKTAEHNPDLILLDVLMQDINGFDVCRQIKSNPRHVHTPIIIVTAIQDKTHLSQGLDAGADDFLAKPVNALELRARVRSLLRVKRQYDELEALINLRTDLSNMVVHDMRSPLTIILGNSQSIKYQTGLPRELSQRIDRIYLQAQRLNNFLNDMLVLAKMEAGKLALDKSRASINQLITEITSSYDEIAEARGLRLVAEIADGPCEITLDHHLLSRVLDNLLSNALKFSPDGESILVKAACEQRGGRFWGVIDVCDQGPGIAPEHRASIFDKFEIVKLKNQNVQQTGLGLAFCKLVMEAHQGTIQVLPNNPQGSIFRLEIPDDRT